MPLTGRGLCTDALLEVGILAAGETASAIDLGFTLTKLARLLDNWNAERAAVYATAFATYTMTAGLSPHTIGPTLATWFATQRPVAIYGASLVLTGGSTGVFTGITLRDAQWWNAQSTPELESTYPTDLYYQPDWPNGSLFFWPVPQAAYDVQLQIRVVLAELALDDVVTMPPGYLDATILTLAEDLCSAFGVPIPPTLPSKAAKARARIFANNDVTPRLRTQDAGMPSRAGGWFNWLTGQDV